MLAPSRVLLLPSLVSQRLDQVDARCSDRRIDPENHAEGYGHSERHEHGDRRYDRFPLDGSRESPSKMLLPGVASSANVEALLRTAERWLK